MADFSAAAAAAAAFFLLLSFEPNDNGPSNIAPDNFPKLFRLFSFEDEEKEEEGLPSAVKLFFNFKRPSGGGGIRSAGESDKRAEA